MGVSKKTFYWFYDRDKPLLLIRVEVTEEELTPPLIAYSCNLVPAVHRTTGAHGEPLVGSYLYWSTTFDSMTTHFIYSIDRVKGRRTCRRRNALTSTNSKVYRRQLENWGRI